MRVEFLGPDSPEWEKVLGRLRHDVFHLPTYLQHAAAHEGGEPVAFHARDDDAEIFVPMLLRPLPAALDAPAEWRDAAAPYGYPTPLLSPAGDSAALRRMFDVFRSAAAGREIISAFLRLHPNLPLPAAGLGATERVVDHGETVYIDLTEPADALDSQVRDNHRRNVRTLERDGFRAEIDDWSRFEDFLDIYRATMTRLGAREFYFFPRSYFMDLREALGGRLHLCTVISPQGRTACAKLLTETDGIVQYHLAGTAEEFLSAAPTKLAIVHARNWARSRGNRIFHLGGGPGGRSGSLFGFKAGFSRHAAPLLTLRATIDEARCAELDRRRRACGCAGADDSFFPAYRRPCTCPPRAV